MSIKKGRGLVVYKPQALFLFLVREKLFISIALKDTLFWYFYFAT
jgi:hypothetical protein